jgi:hypothetical protein
MASPMLPMEQLWQMGEHTFQQQCPQLSCASPLASQLAQVSMQHATSHATHEQHRHVKILFTMFIFHKIKLYLSFLSMD